MPWKATEPMKERTKFVLEWERRWREAEGGPVNIAELCRMFGISRPTGYTWIDRYREGNHDLLAVTEKSRRPKTSPTAISIEVEDLIVAQHVQRILDSAFLEFGRPKFIRSDGGPPFASTGPAMLTQLSVWLLRLGIPLCQRSCRFNLNDFGARAESNDGVLGTGARSHGAQDGRA